VEYARSALDPNTEVDLQRRRPVELDDSVGVGDGVAVQLAGTRTEDEVLCRLAVNVLVPDGGAVSTGRGYNQGKDEPFLDIPDI